MSPIAAISLVLGLLVTACATAPAVIREAPPGDLQLAEARDNVSVHKGTPVRWGGTIISLENKQDETWIEVLESKLSRSGEPKRYSRSDGRFLIRVEGFLDPAIYAKGREITVVGTLEGEAERSVGKQPYSFPVVKADDYHLWRPYYYGYYPYYYGHHPYYYSGYHYRYGHDHHGRLHFGHRHHHGFHIRFHH